MISDSSDPRINQSFSRILPSLTSAVRSLASRQKTVGERRRTVSIVTMLFTANEDSSTHNLPPQLLEGESVSTPYFQSTSISVLCNTSVSKEIGHFSSVSLCGFQNVRGCAIDWRLCQARSVSSGQAAGGCGTARAVVAVSAGFSV